MKFKIGKKKYKYLYINIYTARSQMAERDNPCHLWSSGIYIYKEDEVLISIMGSPGGIKNNINYKKVSSTRKKRN